MEINFSSPINDTGYGIASLNILKALFEIHNNISFFPIGSPSVHNKNDYDIIYKLLNNQDEFNIDAPFIKIWHQFDLAQRVGRGKYYAYPFFELDTFNKREKKHLSVPNEIFVSSNWAKDILIDNGIKSNINVVPLGVDRLIFNHNLKKQRNNNKYVFLNIGKWEVRKGHDILIDLFKRAFQNNENVELWVLAAEHNNSYSSSDEIKHWHKLYSDDRVKIIRGCDTQQDVANIIAEADCGIYPSRAEGWNMELLETMSMGKPVITTNYSAHTEFCNKENAYLVDINDRELAYDGKAFNKQGHWAKINNSEKDLFIDYMRNMVKNNITTNIQGIETAKKYSWKNSANIISRCIC